MAAAATAGNPQPRNSAARDSAARDSVLVELHDDFEEVGPVPQEIIDRARLACSEFCHFDA